MAIGFGIRVAGIGDLAALEQRLREAADGRLQRRLTQRVNQDANPALQAVRAAWGTVDVTSRKAGGSSSGLRTRVAAATDVDPTGTGAHFEVDGEAVDAAYGRNLAWYLDGHGRWRHPTFGRRERPEDWEQQSGQEVFHRTLYGREPEFRRGLEQVVDEIAAEIEG